MLQKFKELQNKILNEIQNILNQVDEKQVENFISEILKAKRVFVIGAGRVKLMIQAFAKRIDHIGITSYVVGETTTPGIKKGDLLIVSSGSGETIIPVNIAKLAKKYGARIALVTANPESTLGKISNVTVKLPAPTKFSKPDEPKSFQPMTSLYEQCSLIFFDAVAIMIVKKKKVTEKQLWQRHANLE